MLEAAKTRATGTGSEPVQPNGPPKHGGLYVLDVQGTPESDCLAGHTSYQMIPDEAKVLQKLYDQWQTDPSTKQNVNVIAGDYVEATYLVQDAIAMNEAKFASPGPRRSPGTRGTAS